MGQKICARVQNTSTHSVARHDLSSAGDRDSLQVAAWLTIRSALS